MNKTLVFILFYLLPLPVVVLSLFVGSSEQAALSEYIPIVLKKLSGAPLHQAELQYWQTANNILWNIRLPRVLLTFIIGAALGVSGTVLQGILKNPLVDSYILGISSASAFGASLSLAFGFLTTNVTAFAFAVLSVFFTFLISNNKGVHSIVSVVLSGMIVSGIFTALLSAIQYIVNPFKLSAIVQWTLGNLHAASWKELNTALLPIGIAMLVVFALRERMNLLALGDDAAKAVGVNPLVDKVLLIIAVTVMTAASVSAVGIISMYGLFLPHIVRMVAGANHNITIPGSILFGGTFLLIIDDVSRTLFEFEVPIGIFTMILGGVFFIYLMKKNKLNWF